MGESGRKIKLMGNVTGVLNLFCGIMAFVVWVTLRGRQYKSSSGRIFERIMLTISVMLLSDSFALLFCHKRSAAMMILYAISFAAYYSILAFYTIFIMNVIEIPEKIFKAERIFVLTACGISGLMWIATSFYPFMFDIVTRQRTGNAFFYIFAYILSLAVPISNLIIIIIGTKGHFSKTTAVLVLFPFLPIISPILDMLFDGLSSRYSLIFLVSIIIVGAIVIYSERIRREQEAMLEKYRITSTLERIKPHYIYNVLTSISYLCEYDPPTAQKALGVFSDYLRSVLSKMDDRSVVPFSEEIKTVKKYISLEKMRFGNRFLVKYVIDAKDFEIPPFTLQPLVENSVKHGLADIDEQGVIEIKTHEDAYGYYIIVSDNGKGFDTAEDESSGEGTKYIKDILSLTVNGLLTIDSVVGKGTVSTIYIPKVNKD